MKIKNQNIVGGNRTFTDPRFASVKAEQELIAAFSAMSKRLNKARSDRDLATVTITGEELQKYMSRLQNAIVFATPNSADVPMQEFFANDCDQDEAEA